MTSTLGSARATPEQGHVKLVPSIRNRFSLLPEPKADTVLTVPLEGDVGEIPGVALMASNILNRRVGMVLGYAGPRCASMPLPRASSREPDPSTTSDSAMPASFRITVLESVALAPMLTSPS